MPEEATIKTGKSCCEFTLRRGVRNAVPLMVAGAVPPIVHALTIKSEDPFHDEYYTALPLWTTTMLVAAFGLLLYEMTDFLLERAWPREPSRHYKSDRPLRFSALFAEQKPVM